MYGLNYRQGSVIRIIKEREEIQFLEVEVDDSIFKAINYTRLVGCLKEGDIIKVNTTAVDLELGTGGFHFVISSMNNKKLESKDQGHIMKLRYTPFQVRTNCGEEYMDSSYFKKDKTLQGKKVFFIPLHSMLSPFCLTAKSLYPQKKIVYIMSEGGSLALSLSETVYQLKAKGLLDKTITYGQAFGGDLETVNIFTALLTAKFAEKADIIIIGMGPGLAGTGTELGFSGAENSLNSYAVHLMQGKSIIVPRISLAENRERHTPISHHTITLLNKLIKHRVEVVFPDFKLIKNEVEKKLSNSGHIYKFHPIDRVHKILKDSNFSFNSMGKGLSEDPLFFITAGLAVYNIFERGAEKHE